MQANDRWAEFWRPLGVAGNTASHFAEVERRYAEPHRAYHNLAHVMDCLEKFDSARQLARNPVAVEMALWYHDAVYDPRAMDNEERSAALAAQVADEAGLADTLKSQVIQLILATKKHDATVSEDAPLVVDIDLSILGAAPPRFDEYECQIRQEYDWVPQDSFAVGRTSILQGFLARPAIFSTETFRGRFEQQARENLKCSIARLASQLQKSTA